MVWILMTIAVVSAWDTDNGFHERVNKHAIEDMEQWLKTKSPYSSFSGTTRVEGCSAVNHDIECSETGEARDIRKWIEWGGYLADYPYLTKDSMVLYHFFEPFTAESLTILRGDTTPEWLVSPDNPYSWKNAEEYLKMALGSSENNNNYYGLAWRSAGETMHLVADMTNPAHVRNDPHLPYIDPDPDEISISGDDVTRVWTGGEHAKSPSINYEVGEETGVMYAFLDDVAEWTNKNFVSDDTIVPDPGDTAEEEIISDTPPSIQYFNGTVDGTDTVTYAKVPFLIPGDDDKIVKMTWVMERTVDEPVVLKEHGRLLIPQAVYSASAVLKSFFPRFNLSIDSFEPVPDSQVPGTYHLIARLSQLGGDLVTVRNGAYTRVYDPEKSATGDFAIEPVAPNEYRSEPGTTYIDTYIFLDENACNTCVDIFFNLGGYIIRSHTPGNENSWDVPGSASPRSEPLSEHNQEAGLVVPKTVTDRSGKTIYE